MKSNQIKESKVYTKLKKKMTRSFLAKQPLIIREEVV